MDVRYLLLCLAVFLAAYFFNIFYMTVFYHRGLTHRAIRLRPFTQRLVVMTGNWITGLDPKAWSCMHRMHHLYADTERDPHSPSHHSLPAIMLVQLKSYQGVLRHLIKGKEPTCSIVADLDFPVSWLNRKKLWMLPYLLHAAIAVGIVMLGGHWLLAAAYWLGMMSHPVQGWMVNALAHRFGYRNFDTSDDSTNNMAVALLVMGEGFQNNHHQDPLSPKFSVKPWEFDAGYLFCRIAEKLRLIDIPMLAR